MKILIWNLLGEVDSEVIPLLMSHFLEELNLLDSIKNTIHNLSGEVSLAGTYQKGRNYFYIQTQARFITQ